ncbi:MAG TPA: TonB family protein [Myxococcota bacterium]|nr:TonB family protein [Myxococcota bacterium]
MTLVLSLLTAAYALDPLWVIEADAVTFDAPVTLPSPNELGAERPAPGCGVLLTLDADERGSLPTRECSDRKLFEALRDAGFAAQLSWTTPASAQPDAVILLVPDWPSDPDQPIPLVARRAVDGRYEVPAKYVGAAKKLAPDQKHCDVKVRFTRSGAGEIDAYQACDKKIQKAVVPAFDVWTWKVPPEIPHRPLFGIVRFDFFDAVPVRGKTAPLVLVSRAGPRLDPDAEQPKLPKGLSAEAKAATTCWLSVTVDPTGVATDARALQCHAELTDAAIAAAKAWEFLPASVDGQLVTADVTVRVAFEE